MQPFCTHAEQLQQHNGTWISFGSARKLNSPLSLLSGIAVFDKYIVKYFTVLSLCGICPRSLPNVVRNQVSVFKNHTKLFLLGCNKKASRWEEGKISSVTSSKHQKGLNTWSENWMHSAVYELRKQTLKYNLNAVKSLPLPFIALPDPKASRHFSFGWSSRLLMPVHTAAELPAFLYNTHRFQSISTILPLSASKGMLTLTLLGIACFFFFFLSKY